ncbi:metallophosphoesterase, partial [Burkholderia multivorans]
MKTRALAVGSLALPAAAGLWAAGIEPHLFA